MFWIEVLLMLFPLVVLRVAKLRNDSRMLFLSALSALLGCATWRLTYSLVAFNRAAVTPTSRPGKNC